MKIKDLKLKRVVSNCNGTFGVMLDSEDRPFAVTLELPWENNKQNVSCIPAGEYKCQSVQSPKFGDTWEICGVKGRDDILFHKGNYLRDTHGCILVGLHFGLYADGKPCIVASKEGFNELRDKLAGARTFNLKITNSNDSRSDIV